MSDDVPGQAFTGRFDAHTQRILPDDWVTHVHLLRHGEVDQLTRRVVRGQMDVPLSPRGAEQNRLLASWLGAHEPRPDAVWSSDLARCRVLAEALGERFGVPVRVDPRLREQSMGAWEGRTWAQITAAEPAAVTAFWDGYHDATPTGGESFAALAARARAAWEDLLRAHRGERVQVVTHIGVLRALLCRVLGVPGTDALRFAPATASHTLVSVSEAGAVVPIVGERPWLFGAPRATAAVRAGEPLCIALSGSAGTGKTTLGRRLAAELGLPFVEEGMRRRIEAGFVPHGYGVPQWTALIRELWAEQRDLEARAPEGFVADRSSFDFAAFWLHYGLYEDVPATEAFLAEMAEHARGYTRVVLLPWGALPLRADGVRSTNRWTQLRFQAVLEGVIERFADGRVLRVDGQQDVEARVRSVLGALRPDGVE